MLHCYVWINTRPVRHEKNTSAMLRGARRGRQ